MYTILFFREENRLGSCAQKPTHRERLSLQERSYDCLRQVMSYEMLRIVIIGFAKLKISDSRGRLSLQERSYDCLWQIPLPISSAIPLFALRRIPLAFGKYHCRFYRQYHYKKSPPCGELFLSINRLCILPSPWGRGTTSVVDEVIHVVCFSFLKFLFCFS